MLGVIKILEIVNNQITLTKGDSAILNLTIYFPNMEEQYELMDGDIVTFSITDKTQCFGESKIVVKKDFKQNEIQLKPIDTKYLSCGKYEYDVQLTFKNGDVNTIIGPELFYLTTEITPSNTNRTYNDYTPSNDINRDDGQLIGILNAGIKKIPVTDLNLEDLEDVELKTPQEGEILSFFDNKWKNSDIEKVLNYHTLILDGGYINDLI